MAEKITELKRVYNIPLRKEWLKTPRYKRAKRAVVTIKRFLTKHMKSTNIKLGQNLNLKVWERGIKSPPHHVLVNVTRDSEGIVKAEMVGFDYNENAPEQVVKKGGHKGHDHDHKHDELEKKVSEKNETTKVEKKADAKATKEKKTASKKVKEAKV